MERKIGETFEFEGKKIEVKAASNGECDGCILDGICTRSNQAIAGKCEGDEREDRTSVKFVEAKDEQPHEQDEQPQDELPQELNLCEVLKYCPQGEIFWSPMLDGVKFSCIDEERQMIIVETIEGHFTWEINADGTISIDEVTSPEIMLYPSREQRDWTKVKYEPKKELPKTWEEFCKQNDMKKGDCFISEDSEYVVIEKGIGMRDENFDRNLLPSREAAEAHLALMQLHQLRDAWREGWVPDWNDYSYKFVIRKRRNEYEVLSYCGSSHFLSFQDKKRAEEFKDFFIDLIRKAGDLI